MKTGKKLAIFFVACLILGTVGCTGENAATTKTQIAGLDKLGEVSVISREEGSGTRGAFAQLVGFDQSNGDKPDLTREDVIVKQNAEEAIEAVREDKSAIAYVSKGALINESDIKILSINGVGVDAKNNKYPLSRSFYVVYSGELSELEQDFLVYIHGAGQEIVGKSYVPVAKTNTFLSNQKEGKIKVIGSTSVAPLMEELAAAYMEINHNAIVTVVETDSSDGINKAIQGECNLGISSRDLKDYEKELLNYEIIATDDIAVIVNKENPLTDITLDLLKSIYVGDIKKWEELNK